MAQCIIIYIHIRIPFAPELIKKHIKYESHYTHAFKWIYLSPAFFEQVILSQVGWWVAGGLNIGVLNEGGRWMESIDPVMALCGSSLHLNHSKLSDITASKLSVKSQFISHNSNKAWMAPIVHLWLSQSQGKAAIKSRPTILQGNAECRMKVYWNSCPFLVKFKCTDFPQPSKPWLVSWVLIATGHNFKIQ